MRKYLNATCKALAVVVFAAVVAACGHNSMKKGTSDVTAGPAQYDLTVLADKDGQFEFDGATLTAEDLRGHIRYLNESGRTVHTILLKRGEKEKVKNEHVAALASVARDLKVTGYVEDNDGRLKIVQVVE